MRDPHTQAGTRWRRATRCNSAECVEVAATESDTIVVRSTGSPDNAIGFSRGEWAVFIEAVKVGEFDLDTF